jgi:hypothetical protein
MKKDPITQIAEFRQELDKLASYKYTLSRTVASFLLALAKK